MHARNAIVGKSTQKYAAALIKPTPDVEKYENNDGLWTSFKNGNAKKETYKKREKYVQNGRKNFASMP